MKRFAALLSLVFATFLLGCTGTATERSTGRVVDDASITARVKTEIAQAAGVASAAQVNVDTYRGVVSLAGFVDNAEQARTLVSAARRVPGVVDVKNAMQVKPKP